MTNLRSELYSYRRLDDRWKNLTQEILKKSNYTCEICGFNHESRKYIQVHHNYYFEDRDPWDYEKEALQPICMACHSKVDHSTIVTYKNCDIEEMKKYPFILTKRFVYVYNKIENLNYNKFFNIKLYSWIIDCGYLTRIQGGDGRFDYELAYRELTKGDPAYSQRKNGEIKKSNSFFFNYQQFENSIFLFRRAF